MTTTAETRPEFVEPVTHDGLRGLGRAALAPVVGLCPVAEIRSPAPMVAQGVVSPAGVSSSQTSR